MPRPDALAVNQATALAEFARACKGAARAVSLYPRTHPSIRTSLDRLTSAAGRLMAAGELTLLVYPDNLLLDGRAPARPDSAVAELAALFHERLVSELTIEREADADDWHALLLLLAKSPEDLLHGGGFGKAFSASGRQHVSVREIDYAEVLRERGGRRKADWDHIIARCVAGSESLDERALSAVLDALGDPQLFAELIDYLQTAGPDSALAIDARAAALLQMLQGAMAALADRSEDPSRVLDTAAAALPRLTPEMVLALVKERTHPERGQIADDLLKRVTDGSIAEFVANSVTAENGATERLAQAFEALVPDGDRKSDVLNLAAEVARRATTGGDGAFETLWQGAREMLLSYTDTTYVSTAYSSRALVGTPAGDRSRARVRRSAGTRGGVAGHGVGRVDPPAGPRVALRPDPARVRPGEVGGHRHGRRTGGRTARAVGQLLRGARTRHPDRERVVRERSLGLFHRSHQGVGAVGRRAPRPARHSASAQGG